MPSALRALILLGLFGAVAIAAAPRSARAAETGDELDLEALFNTSQVGIATKRAQSTREAPAIVEVISAEEIRERGYGTVAEALRSVPGFYVVDDLLLPNVGVRGISSGQRSWSRIVKVMIDGQSVSYRPDGSNWLGPELIPVDLIKRIEVIRGPASALYGADAFLGVINVVTRRGPDLDGTQLGSDAGILQSSWQGRASAAYGTSADLANLDLTVGGTIGRSDRSGLMLAASSPLATDPTLANTPSANDLTGPSSLFGRITVPTPLDLGLTLDGTFQHLDSGGEFQDWKPLTHQNRLVEENRVVRAQAQKAIAPNLSYSGSVAYSQGSPTLDDTISLGRNDKYIRPTYKAEEYDLASDVTWDLGERNTLTVGADWTRTNQTLPSYTEVFISGPQNGSTQPTGAPGSFQQLDNLGAYVQGIYYPTDQLGLTANLRDDAQNVYGNNLNSRLGLVYLFNDALSAKALYGSSFKAPSAPQLFGTPLIFGDILGNKDLKPERANTLEGSVQYTPNRATDLTGTVYYNRVSDKVEFFTRAGNPFAVNLGQLDSAGLEGSYKWRWNILHGMLNSSLQATVPTLPSGFPDPNGYPEPYPAWMVNAGVGAPVASWPLSAWLEARYVSAMPSSQANFAANGHETYTIPAAVVADLTLTSRDVYLFGDKETLISFKAANLFNTPTTQPGFGGIDYPGLGRSFLLRMSQTF
jgi:iron complex outermembrane receptor protein